MANWEEDDARELNRLFLPVGTVLRGKYRIDRVIGTGGMAVVYAATHRNRKRFAVKVLHPEFSTRREVRARFVREGYLANSVEHSGVVSVLDDDVTEEGAAFLVMELLEGATVEGFSPRARPLPLRESLAIATDVLDVLDVAHAKGIVHRDIKPANLYVTRQGQLKILDFGIARLRDATLELKATGTGATLGTPAFMAPEQALALAGEIEARTDLWAVGATLFTMLSGSLVHPGENARQVMIRAATQQARSLASVAPDVPPAVVEWVDRALSFDKSARWESAAAMRDAGLCILRELFGATEDGCAKRLFELCPEDLATLPTELSPMGALRSVVRETSRTTVESSPGTPGVSSSLPAPRLSARSGVARGWRVSVALLVVTALAVGVGLAMVFAHPTGPSEKSLSAARTAAVNIEASPSAGANRSSKAVGAAIEASPVAASETGNPVQAHPSASTRPVVVALAPVPSSRSAVLPKGGPVSQNRAQSPSEPAPHPTTLPPAATDHVPSLVPTHNPLQIEIQ